MTVTDLPGATPTEGARRSVDSPPTAPRWVKALALVGVVGLVLLAVALLTGGGHGPARHTSADQPPAGKVSATLPALSRLPTLQ